VDPTPLFQQLGVSVLLGMLVGLQRQRANSPMAGLRTFPLITVLGTVSAALGMEFGGWVVAAGFLALVVILLPGGLAKLKDPESTRGTTTHVTVLLMYAVGAFLVVGPLEVGIAIGGGVAVLLQFKPELHNVARRLGDADLKAVMQFVLITCIILPVLPNQTYGPLDVINPFKTWLMVVLIVGMSLSGYIVYKFLGREAGILLGGILGGAISSTATTVSYGRQGKLGTRGSRTAAVVIMIASTVVFVRVLIEIAVVSRGFLLTAAPPILILMTLTLLPSLVLWLRVRREPSELPQQENPTQLKSAIVFGVMYAMVLLALAAAREYAGDEALYLVAGLSGLTDMDAITLSAAQMTLGPHGLAASDGWRLIVVAALANFVFKAALVGVIGHRRLLGQIALLFSVPMVGGILLLLFWPG